MGALSLFANILVLYLIRYHSKFASPAYQAMLAIDTSLDLVLCIFVLLGQPISMVGDGFKIYFCDGFFAGRSHTLDSILLSGWMLCSFYNVMWIAIQFVYRYTIVCLQHDLKKSKRIIRRMASAAFTWWAVGTWFTLKVDFEEQPEGLRILALNHWEIGEHGRMVTGGNVSTLTMKLWITLWIGVCIASATVVVIFEFKINQSLKVMARNTNRNTLRMHVEFHRALLAMAICPLITCSVPILLLMFAASTRSNLGPKQVFLTMGTHAITIVNPLTTMFFMRSYREVVVGFVWRRKPSAGPCQTRVTGLSLASATATSASRVETA